MKNKLLLKHLKAVYENINSCFFIPKKGHHTFRYTTKKLNSPHIYIKSPKQSNA